MKLSAVFLTCLLVFYAQGQPANRSSRCQCLNGSIDRIHPQLIKEGPVVHRPSIFCTHVEITLTTTANKKKCVDPQSHLGRLILKNHNKHEKNRAVTRKASS